MTTRQKNRHYMLENVVALMEKNREQWQELPEFKETFDRVTLHYEEIKGLIVEKDRLLHPFGEVKQEAWDRFADKVGQLAAYVHVIHRQQGRSDLSVYTDFTIKSLTRGAVNTAFTKARSVIELAEAVQTALAETSEGSALLEETRAILDDFLARGLEPSKRRRLLADVNLRLTQAQDRVRDVLKNELDMLMRLFKERDPDFYSLYLRERKVPNLAASHSREEASDQEPDPEDPTRDPSPPEDEDPPEDPFGNQAAA